ncbi:MAG: 16S rRNA (adenine(1518)-N(6)/adenine(1519)-N(6))-dimethyltransferase RsmA [Firmicutes bacterium]|nr:16S rRNA (adenine(1518)-N(6)/adenine(1519)-N(6))-dimethyltransferase RsmA [Bacillota bacterium]
MYQKIATPARTREILEENGFTIKKGYGQNFLIDGNILERIIEAGNITKDDFVMEIGPGLGGLTQYLCENAKEVLAVEIDKSAIPILEKNLSRYENLTIINADILKVDIAELLKDKKNIKIAANLPYYITTPVIMELLERRLNIESITVMVQKEVAQRMQAKPGSPDYGALSLAVEFYSEAHINMVVKPTCFIPRPKVDSAVITMKIRDEKPVNVGDEELLFRIIKSAFGQRRKTLVNSIYNQCGFDMSKEELADILNGIGFDERIRGEALSLEDFARLTEAITDKINNK